MKFVTYYIVAQVLLLPLFVSAAAIPLVYTNDNFWSSTHDVPTEIRHDTVTGNFSGYTATGKYFTQTHVANSAAVRLMRFSIDEAFFYVSDRGVIVAANDTQALSMYLTMSTAGV
jgi:hypothetical protein